MNTHLKELVDFLGSSKRNHTDLQVVKTPNEWLDPLLGVKASKFFKIYFRNAAGDLVGEWDTEGKFLEDNSYPIVWLSSEGAPNTVVAKNSTHFISILPYGQGIMTGIPVLIERHKQKPTKIVAPEKKYNKSAVEEEYQYQAQQFEGHKELVEFITKTLKIKINEDPLQAIKDVMESTPNLDEWIKQNLNN